MFLRKPYSTWEQMAGYFDGDGSVSIFLWKFTIAFYLDWADLCREQLEQILLFLRSQGIKTGLVRKMSSSQAFALRIGDQESVLIIAEHLFPFWFKKRQELPTLLDYRKDDLISGSEVQRRFKWFVETGARERHGARKSRRMPWSYTEGYRLSRKNRALLSHRLGVRLGEAQKREARERHKVFGESISALAKSYGVSRSAVWRALRID